MFRLASPENQENPYMNPSRALLTTAFALSLTACGGGGGDDAPPPAAPAQTSVSLAEFEGVWKRDATQDDCKIDFDYNTAYASRIRDVTLTNKGNGVLEISNAVLVYGDDACTVKQGLVTERFTMNVAPATRAGRDNVIKGVVTFVGSTLSGDGGLGLSLNAMPDGRMSGLTNGTKAMGDVHNARLQFAGADAGEPVDAEGYPTDFIPENYFVR
jgi:hypothetical protein